MQGEHRGGSGHGPWRHGGAGRRTMDDSRQTQATHQATAAPAWLRISQTDGSITFTTSDGLSQTLPTNNKKQKFRLYDRTVEVRAKWDDGRLVRETSLGEGMKLTETYSVSSSPRRLLVVAKLEGSHLSRPVSLRRVYDPESQP